MICRLLLFFDCFPKRPLTVHLLDSPHCLRGKLFQDRGLIDYNFLPTCDTRLGWCFTPITSIQCDIFISLCVALET